MLRPYVNSLFAGRPRGNLYWKRITRAPGGVRADTRSLNRNLIVAPLPSVLAGLLIVLVGELAQDTRTAA